MVQFHVHRGRPKLPPTKLAYQVRSLGRMRDQPYHSTPGTYHDDVMLTLVLGGCGWYIHAGRRMKLSAGMMGLVVGTSQDPGLMMADVDEPYDHIYCRFNGQEARERAAAILAARGDAAFLHEPRWQEVAAILLRALAVGGVSSDHTSEEPRRQDGALLEVLALLSEPRVHAGYHLSAEALRVYLEQHIVDLTHLDAVASHFAVSKSHLCRQAKRLLGMPLHDYWERMKMDWACVLLREPDLSIAEVSRRVGYADPFYFSKVFKRRIGQPPSCWRKQIDTTFSSEREG